MTYLPGISVFNIMYHTLLVRPLTKIKLGLKQNVGLKIPYCDLLYEYVIRMSMLLLLH